MNIGIVHGFVGGGGGTEKTLLAIIELFVERDHKVTLYTFSKPSISIPGIRIESKIPFRFPLFGLYQRSYETHLLKQATKNDLIIQASGGLSLPNDPKKNVIVYCHNDFQNEIGKNVTKYQGLWSIYYKPYAKLNKNLKTLIQNQNIHLIANSNFTQSSIYTKYNKDSKVIYPPVDISEFTNDKLDKKKQVVTISRFSQEKNLDFAIRVIEKVDSHYLLIGNTKTKTNQLYFNQIRSKMNSNKLKIKMNLLKNIARNDLINHLKTSKIYFHPSPETFGISVIEAIAAGCIPIVPDNSAHKETVKFDQLRFIPNSVEDASEKISQGLSGKFDKLKDLLKQPLQQYSKNAFKNNFKIYLEKELSINI